MPDSRRYHIVLATGEERDVRATEVFVRDGVLEFHSASEIVIAYGQGAWVMVEAETRDDR